MQSDYHNREIVIEVQDVHKCFREVKAVQGIDLQIRRGQFLALLGPNGAGKTTLVEMIEGIQKPDSGKILIKGLCWKGHQETIHQIIGISLQETRFIDKLTISETLRLFSSFYNLPSQRIEEIIELTGLQEKRKSYVVNLSGGQRQRLALGIAMLNQPEILLLDEPTTGLDPSARRDIWNILLNLKNEYKTSLILTTHYMEEAEHLCDYIVLIDKGKIISQGTLPDLLGGGENLRVIDFTIEGDISSLDQLNPSEKFRVSWDAKRETGTLYLDNFETQLSFFLDFLKDQKLRIKNFECRRTTLNDIFLSLTGRKLNE
jgi:ABC-2 type transport system ATP-binding protein